MRPEHQRLLRLQRLETVRAMAKRTAAREAAEAESTLKQLETLAARTGRMIADYSARTDASNGEQLRQLSSFREGLNGVSRTTQSDAGRARTHADLKLAQLAEAERRRQAVEDRAKSEAQTLAQKNQQPPLGARRGFGTPLE
jgi:hypothetical protein